MLLMKGRKVSKKTSGVNIYLGTQDEKEQALENLGAIATALRFESVGPMIKWLATRSPGTIIEALKPIRKVELAEQLDKLS